MEEQRTLRILSEADRGIYDAMSKGVRMATGDVIGILNADDVYPDARVLANVARAFAGFPVDAVYGDCVYADSKDLTQVRRYWRAGRYREGAFAFGWMPPHPTFYVRREVYERLGAFNADFKSAGDYELMLRFVHKHKIRLKYIPEVLVVMREGGVSNRSLKNRLRANREDRRAWELNGLRMPFYTRYLKPLRKIPQLWAKKPESLNR